MKTANEKLLDWLINKIEREYKDDVSLVIGNDLLRLEQDTNGSYFNYFIPANEKACTLARTFIIDGIGYDLYPRSWESIENSANLDDYNPTCLGNVEILYYRSEEDKQRFLAMQTRMRENLADPGFMFKKALEKLNIAMEIYQTMMFEDKAGKVRMAAGFIADYLSVSVAFANQTYFKYSQIDQMAELSSMNANPDNFLQCYKSIINADSVDELKKLSHEMISNTRRFLSSRKPENEIKEYNRDFRNLADWYQELCYTWRRIYWWCDKKDVQKAFVWGCGLQHELDIVKEEFGLEEMDLLSSFIAGDLTSFRRTAERLERYIVEEIGRHGVKLEKYDTIDDFLAMNS